MIYFLIHNDRKTKRNNKIMMSEGVQSHMTPFCHFLDGDVMASVSVTLPSITECVCVCVRHVPLNQVSFLLLFLVGGDLELMGDEKETWKVKTLDEILQEKKRRRELEEKSDPKRVKNVRESVNNHY